MFYGIVVAMFYNDHAPPHFHARYSGSEATYQIDTLEVFAGELPHRAHTLVVEWAHAHRVELELAWEKARRQEPLNPIAPLD
jgi:hypothetical protein